MVRVARRSRLPLARQKGAWRRALVQERERLQDTQVPPSTGARAAPFWGRFSRLVRSQTIVNESALGPERSESEAQVWVRAEGTGRASSRATPTHLSLSRSLSLRPTPCLTIYRTQVESSLRLLVVTRLVPVESCTERRHSGSQSVYFSPNTPDGIMKDERKTPRISTHSVSRGCCR